MSELLNRNHRDFICTEKLCRSVQCDKTNLWYADGTALVLRNSSGVLLHTLKGPKSGISSLVSDGNRVFCGHVDGSVNVWEYKCGEYVWKQSIPGKGAEITSIQVIGGEIDSVIAVDSKGNMFIYNKTSYLLSSTIRIDTKSLYSVAVSQYGDGLVAIGGMGRLYIYDAKISSHITTLAGHTGPIYALAMLPTDDNISIAGEDYWMVSGGEDKHVIVWRTDLFSVVKKLCGHCSAVTSILTSVFPHSFKEPIIVSGSRDRTIKVWNARNGMLLHTLNGSPAWIVSLSLSTDEEAKNPIFIYASCQDNTIRRWRYDHVLNWERRKHFALCLSGVGMIFPRYHAKYSIEELANLNSVFKVLIMSSTRSYICSFL